MTGLIVLMFVPAIAAVMFALRSRRQKHQINELLSKLITRGIDDRERNDERRALLGTVAHELRSPIGAILGYVELLEDGLYGPLDERAGEPLSRIRSSAHQLLALTDGMHELAGDGGSQVLEDLDIEDVNFAELLRSTIERARVEVDARRVVVELIDVPQLLSGRSDPRIVATMLDAALGCALKSSAERTLDIRLSADTEAVTVTVRHTGIIAENIERDRFANGAALRFAIARRLAERLQGRVDLVPEGPETALHLQLKRRLT